MREPRWVRRIGPAVAALGAVALVASTTLGARERAWEPPPCATATVAADRTESGRRWGTWYRLDPQLRDGVLVGQRVTIGRGTSGGTRFVDLPRESFAAGPFDGFVLVGSDDGERSSLALLDVPRGCRIPVATSPDVVRRATLTPDGSAIVEMRVDRATRADLGVFRRSLHRPEAPVRILPPVAADARFGPTWTTEFAWSPDGRRLAVQSCGERACRTRVLDAAGRLVVTVADPELADLVGVTAEHLVVHATCGGLPCPIIAVRLADHASKVLVETAGQATLGTGADGRPVLIHEVDADGRQLRVIGLDGRDARAFPADRRGRRLVAGPGRSASALEHPPDLIVLGSGGRIPGEGALGPLLRRVSDGAVVAFDEVTP
jgi:hypothetical protein